MDEGNTAGVASALEAGAQEGVNYLQRQTAAGYTGAHAQHVGVVMQAGEFGAVAVAAEGAPSTAMVATVPAKTIPEMPPKIRRNQDI